MRSHILRVLATAVFIGVTASRAADADVINGVVFLDDNANGRRDTGEKGLAGIHVTNGLGFTATECEGRFSIDFVRDPVLRDGGTPIVSVRIPNGYWPTTPWFRRVPKPAAGQRIAFGFRRDNQLLPFTFIHGTDPHVPRSGEDAFLTFRQDVAALADQVRFCILTGDLVDLSDSHSFAQAFQEYEFFTEQTRGFPTPLFCLPGNHDISGVRADSGWDPANPYYGYGFFTHRVGPLRWSFTYAGVHFVGVDYNRLDDSGWKWGVPESAAQWLEADLALVEPKTRIFLFVHFPEGVESFRKVTEQFPVTQVFCGHHHVDRASRFGTIPCLSSGSISQIFADKDRMPGYRLVHVTETGMETFYRATGDRHAVTIDSPRTGGVLKPGDALCGACYDPTREIRRLTVRIGEREEVVPFERGPLWCRFAAALDLTGVAAGVRPISISITGAQPWKRVESSRLVLTDRRISFETQGDTVLDIDVGGIDDGAELYMNGEVLAHLNPTTLKGEHDFPKPVAGTEQRRFALPPARLRRLNRIEFRASLDPEGECDRFCVLDVQITANGRTFRDDRFRHGSENPAYVSTAKVYWIDLTPGQ